MNNEKIAKYIQNIFHLEDMTADDESYNRGVLHSNSWGKGITISWFIRDFGDGKDVVIRYTYTMGSYDIDIDSGMTAQEASKEIVQLIGRVLITQADTVDPNTGMNNVLAWPYNCNLAYVEHLIEALQYGDNEIKSSKKPVKSSKKIIKSSLRKESMDLYLQYRDDIFHAINEVDKKYNMSGVGPFSTKEDFDEVIEWMNIHDYWTEPDEDDDVIESSMQGQEKGIQAIMDEYGCTREEAIDIMNDGITSGCHGKAKKKAKKAVKSGVKAYMTRDYKRPYAKDTNFDFSFENYTPNDIDDLTDLVRNQLKYETRINRFEFPDGQALDVEYDENMNPTFIPSSRKPVKSSASSWEAGYDAFQRGEGYADYPTGLSDRDAEDWMSGWDYANREDKGELTEAEQAVWTEDDEERLRAEYAKENGLDLNEDIIDENDYNEWIHRGAAMYSSIDRNHRNIQALYN